MDALITSERLTEFKRLYLKEFGEELSDEQALEKAIALVRLFRAIYRPIPVEKEALYRELEACYKESTSHCP